ncbi:glutamine amidotransferase [Candidatus Uhrbacteria bacterium CG10_big_fil_rev_8_21_14_0_10_48_16]|uniref:Glutamine amidotransferase n=1 Tax=Candidatus Uhrbacteria bacterium CG10_big_fil_rev_8_21_14_0_10_48_16 TaxID=1975038 RepID=A0A2M8LGP7_9BACT|nr:MAG: glutamine amidotransferase [Candidatus Uhrbacteria bacterium CG10_big_fil_rev_8_21_14_0_10_48_16]
MKPFLILQLRPNTVASDGEFSAFLKYGELSPDEVVRIRMDQDPLPLIDLAEFSGVIVGGGPWNVSDEPDSKTPQQKSAEYWLSGFLQRIIETDTPFLGVCYGLGALAKILGSTISKEQFTENASATNIELLPEAHRDDLLKGLPETFRAIVGHKEACQQLPHGAVHLAQSSACPVQMFRLKKNIYATQFHPELDTEGVQVRIDVYKHAGYFPPEEAESLKKQLRKEKITFPMEILKRFVKKYHTEK